MKPDLKLVSMRDVQTEAVRWLWYPYLPRGKLTIVQGDPGEGKTTFVLAVIAALTRGDALPESGQALEPLNVLYQTAEDGLADTIKPRLEAAGADCSRVLVIDESQRELTLCDERLEEAVRQERVLMEPLKARADVVIDTSHTSTAQLRARLLHEFGSETEQGSMAVQVVSFGFKYGLPMEADLVFDVRFMPNPFYIEELRPRTGLERAVAGYVFSFQQTKEYLVKLQDLLAFSLPLYAEEGKTALVIAVGCTGGRHRSVAVTHALAEFLRSHCGCPVAETHRDIARG